MLIVGESGSGKSHVAQVIHDLSDRRMLPFVNVAQGFPGSVPELLARMQRAGGGTMLFDEVGNMDLPGQAALTAALDAAGSDRPRILATAGSDLQAMIEDGRFRKDLFFRLNGIPVPGAAAAGSALTTFRCWPLPCWGASSGAAADAKRSRDGAVRLLRGYG